MSISMPLFFTEHIALGPIDHDLDAQAVARWTHDPDYLRMLNAVPAMPQTVPQIKNVLKRSKVP